MIVLVDWPRFGFATTSTLDAREVRRNREMSLGADELKEASHRSTIELEPDFAYVWGALGYVYVELGDLNEVE